VHFDARWTSLIMGSQNLALNPNFAKSKKNSNFGTIFDNDPKCIVDNCGQIRIPHKILCRTKFTIVKNYRTENKKGFA
jgi:hypothetical protein